MGALALALHLGLRLPPQLGRRRVSELLSARARIGARATRGVRRAGSFRRRVLRANRRLPAQGGAGSRPARVLVAGGSRSYDRAVVRPGSWIEPAGVSPVPVGAGAPGSRPRFVVERRRAERGVESLFGGSKRVGRSVMRTLQPRQIDDGRAEPLMSRRRPCLLGWDSGLPGGSLRGKGGGTRAGFGTGTGEARLRSLRRAETACISRW